MMTMTRIMRRLVTWMIMMVSLRRMITTTMMMTMRLKMMTMTMRLMMRMKIIHWCSLATLGWWAVALCHRASNAHPHRMFRTCTQTSTTATSTCTPLVHHLHITCTPLARHLHTNLHLHSTYTQNSNTATSTALAYQLLQQLHSLQWHKPSTPLAL